MILCNTKCFLYLVYLFWKILLWGGFLFTVEDCIVLWWLYPSFLEFFFYVFCFNFLRLLAQLHETETAFDEFWIKHQQKLEQCLRLRNFEQNFREVRTSWWQSIFGDIEMIQKKILPALLFTVLVCTWKLSPTFFLYLSLLDILLSLEVWILAYRDITSFFSTVLGCFFSMHPAVYKHSKTHLKPVLYHRN